MLNPIRAVIRATIVVLIALAFAPSSSDGGVSSSRHHHPTPPNHLPYNLDGVGVAVAQTGQFYAAVTAELARQEAARAAQVAQVARARVVRTSPPLGGPCASSKPAGFPDYIIQRESGGDPNARNANGGAFGCAQLLPGHFNPGGTCYGLGYDACWAKMYHEQGLTPWACTPESGCRG